MNNHIIYCHNIDGLYYIGQTYGNNESEWNRRFQNGNGYKQHKRMYEAIQRVGWGNVVTTILFDHLSQEEANYLEVLMIGLYDTTNPSIGYNRSKGGTSNYQGKGSHEKGYRKEEKNEYKRKRRKEHPELFKESDLKWRKKNPDKYRAYQREYQRKKAIEKAKEKEVDEEHIRFAKETKSLNFTIYKNSFYYKEQMKEYQKAYNEKKRKEYFQTEEGKAKQKEKEIRHQKALAYKRKMSHINKHIKEAKTEATRLKWIDEKNKLKMNYLAEQSSPIEDTSRYIENS